MAQKPDTRQRRRDERSLEVDGTISEVVEWDWAGTRNCVYVDDLKALIDGWIVLAGGEGDSFHRLIIFIEIVT